MTEMSFSDAKQGNPQAIASLLNHQLEERGVIASTNLRDGCLEVLLEASEPPDRYVFVDFVREFLTNLEPESIQRVKVEGRKVGSSTSDWSQEFGLEVGSYSMLTFPTEDPGAASLEPVAQPVEKPAEPEIQGVEFSQEDRVRSTFIVVGLVIAIVAISVAVFVNNLLSSSRFMAEDAADSEEVYDPQQDPFREAINKASVTSQMVQSAKTQEDWNMVILQWQETIDLMMRVPSSSPNYKLARQKAVEYQKYLEYAQQAERNSAQ